MYNLQTHLHFMGIGGIGMSGIAKILRQQGYIISGCDKNLEQATITELITIGCLISSAHCGAECNNHNINYLIYSSAINLNHEEIINAKSKGIKVVHRAEILAELMKSKFTIAVGGSHGKTTTTSLISHILLQSQIDPTVIIGGALKNLGSNAHLGKSKFMVVEADESDKSIEKLLPSIALITNIDLEHLDVFKNIEDITNTFGKFINNLPFYGKVVICNDDINCQKLMKINQADYLTYGIDNNSNFMAKNITLEPNASKYDLYIDDNFISNIVLNIPGQHNILNSLGAIAVSTIIEIPEKHIIESLANFEGVERRFSLNGYYKGAAVFDDYAHHPNEIKATIEMANLSVKNKLKVVFQPHRYTRTHHLWHEFIDILTNCKIDELIITDIYSAGETEITNVTSQRLTAEIKSENYHKKNNIKTTYLSANDDFDLIKSYLNISIEDGDMILILGAGKIYQLAKYLTSQN
jgi:UDP-N-acetylmuramate--alanine ligase